MYVVYMYTYNMLVNGCMTICSMHLQVLGRVPYGADWYVLGNGPTSYAAANSSSNADGLFTSQAAYPPRLLDYGSSEAL